MIYLIEVWKPKNEYELIRANKFVKNIGWVNTYDLRKVGYSSYPDMADGRLFLINTDFKPKEDDVISKSDTYFYTHFSKLIEHIVREDKINELCDIM